MKVKNLIGPIGAKNLENDIVVLKKGHGLTVGDEIPKDLIVEVCNPLPDDRFPDHIGRDKGWPGPL